MVKRNERVIEGQLKFQECSRSKDETNQKCVTNEDTQQSSHNPILGPEYPSVMSLISTAGHEQSLTKFCVLH